MSKITNKFIRQYFGHNGVECKVVIHRDGTIERFGSPNAFDRSKDYWQFLGDKASLYSLFMSNRDR